MYVGEYRVAVFEGGRSILEAAARWRQNPVTEEVNRRLWSRWWVATLALVTVIFIAAEVYLPPLSALLGFFPPLAMANFVPEVVVGLLVSVPAFFAFVVVWRVRRLRSSDRKSWPHRAGMADFGSSFYDAGALPVAVATVLLAVGAYVVEVLREAPEGTEVFAAGGLARTILTVALVAGILSVHPKIGTGLGKLLGAGFFVWGMHLAIGFSVPWMTSWWAYLPFVGPYAPQRSAAWVTLVFDLAVACAAWTAAREKCRAAPLWSDAPPPPPPEDDS